jgi:hypothetical protein
MRDNVMRVPSRSLKEQFSKTSDAWKEQSDPIFRFWAEGDWWGFPFFSLSASRYFGDKETLCLYWPLGTRKDDLGVNLKLACSVRRYHRSEGPGFLRRVLCPPGNLTQIRWERHPHGDVGAELRQLRAFARKLRKFIVVENLIKRERL